MTDAAAAEAARLLADTLSGNNAVISAAEEALEQFLAQEGSVLVLLEIARTEAADEQADAVRTAAAIYLKNKVGDAWTVKGAEEKAAYKARFVETLLGETHPVVRKMLALQILELAKTDHPDMWPDLLPTLLGAVQSPEPLAVHNALLGLRYLVKRYEMKPTEKRQPLHDIITHSFPLLLQALGHLLQTDTSVEGATIMKLILKIFYTSVTFRYPIVPDGVLNWNEWFGMFVHILNMPLPEAHENIAPLGQPTDPHERERWPWWCMKKWTARTLNRLLSRFGNPVYADPEAQQFAQYFSTEASVHFIEPLLGCLNLIAEGRYCSENTLFWAVSYIDTAAELANCYALVKPHLPMVLVRAPMCYLRVTEDDSNALEDDPISYIDDMIRPSPGFSTSPRLAMLEMIKNLAKYRQFSAMPVILEFVNEQLTLYSQTSPEQRDYVMRDFVYNLLGVVSETLTEEEPFCNTIEELLMEHFLQDLQGCPVGFVRVRALATLGALVCAEFENPHNAVVLLQAVLPLVQNDPLLGVQIEAAACVTSFINDSSPHEAAREELRAHIGDLCTELFRMMEMQDSEVVVSVLRILIEVYTEEVKPFLGPLLERMVQAYIQQVAAGTEDENAAYVAVFSADAIISLLDLGNEIPGFMAQAEPMLIQAVDASLSPNDPSVARLDLFEQALTILHYTTYHLDELSQEAWKYLPVIHDIFVHHAFDYLLELAPVIENYINRNPDMICSGAAADGRPLINLVWSILTRVMAAGSASQRETRCALYIVLNLLHSCKARLENMLPTILEMALTKLNAVQEVWAEKPQTRTRELVLEIMLSCMIVNPLITLQFMEQQGITQSFFQLVFECAQVMESDLQQREISMAFCAILAIPTADLPPVVQQALTDLVHASIREAAGVLQTELEQAEGEDGDDDDDDDDDDADDDDDGDEDEEDPDYGGTQDQDLQRAMRAALQDAEAAGAVPQLGDSEAVPDDQNVIKRQDVAHFAAATESEARAVRTRYIAGEPVEDEDEDEQNRSSALEHEDTCLFVVGCLRQAREREPGVMDPIFASVPQEDQEGFQALMQRYA